jgi:predicted CoA-substrate-specific enzyme activase
MTIEEDSDNIRAWGVCLGASTISVVQVAMDSVDPRSRPRVVTHGLYTHGGDPKSTLLKAFREISPRKEDKIAATGRKFRSFVNLSAISEPEAVEHAYHYTRPEEVSCPAVVSAGGETFMVYQLNDTGQISNVITGNKCASGTGEFFLQQLRRMDVSLEEAAIWTATEDPYHVSGRCSVFCKSDCTHATNKGIPKSKVTAGLCKMMANKILELLKKVERRNIMITGGTTRNRMMIEYLQMKIPGLIIPEEAPYFEALGAALWALDHPTRPYSGISDLLRTDAAPFETLAPLADFTDRVEFKTMQMDQVQPGDTCILGLDVGSTTTKAVLMRKADNAMLASIYLRTNGDPVGASRRCYRSILEQVRARVDPGGIEIQGLGVCGSGRQIAGLHALTDGVINEIIAHATAAVYFDPEVDTLFEIGGQDAKYTYITNGVASDYAMNEACSAGTGSFLEESAFETLGVAMEDIADIALQGRHPPNFNDQCAAFIASDIKNAIHEGVAHADIVAGLVYSICMNYSNRVKGNRPVGNKVFMQGGVCYNKAVPLAAAALVDKPIIVPPEPGLMGAYGVALEIKKRIDCGLMSPQPFDLQTLADREVRYGKSFTCKGGKEKCDRRCEIATIEIENHKYPFGGACNRYYNLRQNVRYNVSELDLVRLRQRLVFEKYAPQPRGRADAGGRPRVGFNRSFLVNTYFPLYANFFAELGFDPVLPDSASQEGIDQRNAAFCYPVELAHGFFKTLLDMDEPPQVIFLPHFRAVPSQEPGRNSLVCPLVQGETFYLQKTFRETLKKLQARGIRLFMPLVDLTEGLENAADPLIETAVKLGLRRKAARSAFQKALQQQNACLAEMREAGRKILDELAETPDRTAVVILGRPYNAFVEEAHMGIPHKLASRGVPVIPMDFLPLDGEQSMPHMYWGMGQLMLKSARFAQKHPQLFGVYITNFSCGPDSFIIGYFRQIMGQKPSLTLELDSHTADAGLETRIEAFLDIVSAYRNLVASNQIVSKSSQFVPARALLKNGQPHVIRSSGQVLDMRDDRVTMLFPSMGRLATECVSAIFQGKGYNAKALPPAGETELKIGRANTSCKECLPLILTTGAMLNYVHHQKRPDEVVVYFFAGGSGPCRFGQYSIFMEELIKRLQIEDVALLTMTSENGYAGLDMDFQRRGWWAIVISDVMEDIRSMLLANAKDVTASLEIFEDELHHIKEVLRRGDFKQLEDRLRTTARRFRRIPLRRPAAQVPIIFLAGEIFVRRDGLSRQYITERLAEQGFAAICAPVSEWMCYADYLVETGQADCQPTLMERLRFFLKTRFKSSYERRIKSILDQSGLVHAEPVDIETIIRSASPHLSPNLGGEAILTIGSALTEVVNAACGVIAVGPFGCMPNRLSESILSEIMNRRDKLVIDPDNERLRVLLTDVNELPFLAIESDGSPFPQIINAKLEAFCLSARRLHQRLNQAN